MIQNQLCMQGHQRRKPTSHGRLCSDVGSNTKSKRIQGATAELYQDNNLVVQDEDLTQIDKSSVPLRDGSGYLSGLGVMHQLHCLVSLLPLFLTPPPSPSAAEKTMILTLGLEQNHLRQYAFQNHYTQETGSDKEIHVCKVLLARICHVYKLMQ